jgi:hypothetical protein
VATADGQLASFLQSPNQTGTPTARGTNANHEFGGVEGVIGWDRWSGGTTDGASGSSGGVTTTANGGGGMIWGSPATAIPTTGSATYKLLGATAVTANNGSLTPGSVKTASLGVNFATAKVGMEATLALDGHDYALASTGGIAAPGMAFDTLGAFLGSGAVTGNGCAGSACAVRITGFLAGTGASHAGAAFTFNTPGTGGTKVSGVIAFSKVP